MSASEGSYRARVGERSFDVVLREGQLQVDGAPVPFEIVWQGAGRALLLVEGRSVPVVVEPMEQGALRVTLGARTVDVQVQDEQDLLLERFGMAEAAHAGAQEIHAPMPGLVLAVSVAVGQHVQAGEGVLVLEAMKMENELRAPAEGVVQAIHVEPGDAVRKNELLLTIGD